MIEGLVAELSLLQWNILLGAAAAVVTILVGLVKLRKKLFLWLYTAPKTCFLHALAKRGKKQAQRIFEEIRPMLEQEILDTLEGYTEVMQEQKITIASAIAENVEFRNFITGSISVLHDTMAKVADAVEINACDAKAIRERLNTEACGIASDCAKRVYMKPCEDGDDES